MKVSAFQEE